MYFPDLLQRLFPSLFRLLPALRRPFPRLRRFRVRFRHLLQFLPFRLQQHQPILHRNSHSPQRIFRHQVFFFSFQAFNFSIIFI